MPSPSDEDVASFARRARNWVVEHLPRDDDDSRSEQELQALLFDNGFAGIAFPTEYGGAGLTHEHNRAFYDQSAAGHRVPTAFNVSIAMIGATLLDHASELLKRRHIPRILRGDEVWIQLLSEPGAGSDMAGVTTRLTRVGSTYVVNGAKMWSSGASDADWGLCLARSDWHVPKHRGLSMVALPLRDTPGLTMTPIRQVSGADADFCQEFFDDVVVPVDHLVGVENDGWSVAQTLLYHERLATSGAGHGYGLRKPAGEGRAYATTTEELLDIASRRGFPPELRALVAEAYIERTVARFANERIMTGMRTGHYRGPWGSLLKLGLGIDAPKHAKLALAVAGADGVVWDGDDPIIGRTGDKWISCREASIAGGTNEIQRNIVSERLLGLPREPSYDRGIPFDEVAQNGRDEPDGRAQRV
jgi:alkylation response protein AidB-like acyl-CoA dehydrogenase